MIASTARSWWLVGGSIHDVAQALGEDGLRFVVERALLAHGFGKLVHALREIGIAFLLFAALTLAALGEPHIEILH